MPDLYLDSISVDSPVDRTHIAFEPFVGIAPRRYMDLFFMAERKKKDGKVKTWDKSQAAPRFVEYSPSYIAKTVKEQEEILRFEKEMKEKGFK